MHVPKKRQLQFRHFYRSVWRNASREKHAENEVDSFRTGQWTETTGTGSPAHMLNTSATHTVRGGTNNLRRLMILLWWVGINK